MIIQRQKHFLQNLFHDFFQGTLSKSPSSPSPSSDSRNATPVEVPKVLIVSHGRYIKIFLEYFCSLVVGEIKNCSATTFRLIYQQRSKSGSEGEHEYSSPTSTPLHEWSVDGISYLLVSVVPVGVNDTSHLTTGM
jgi:hypothetical protein